MKHRFCLVAAFTVAAGCGDNLVPELGLDDFLPEIPEPTGEPQSVFAGRIEDASELVSGPAQSGVIGDFFIRNSRAHFVIQSETRLIGVVPQGGNLVDAVRLDAEGNPISEDHFGELSMIYLLGRTCEHDRVEVVATGAGGGVAAIRARGFAAANDFISIRGIGLFSVDQDQNPDVDDGVECATTYILSPDAEQLEVLWTLFNPNVDEITGPFGSFADTGGVVHSWSPVQGFAEAGIDSLAGGSGDQPVDYAVYQGPDVAYGVLPRHQDPSIQNASVTIAGVSILLYGNAGLLDILQQDKFFLELPGNAGVTHGISVSVGRDAADAERNFRGLRNEDLADLSGRVELDSGDPAVRARVGVFADDDSDGQIGADDRVISYFDVDPDGNFAGQVRPGNYLLRADVLNEGRSPTVSADTTSGGVSDLMLEVPTPIEIDYNVVDDESGNPIPARIAVVGRHPAAPDERLHSTADFRFGLIDTIFSASGTTAGATGDPTFQVPAGGTYRILASRGTEWSIDSALLTADAGDPPQLVELALRRVAPADQYLSTEYHVHSIGSPDSIVPQDVRIRTALADGVELFAATDHDFVGVLQPMVEALGVESLVRVIPGIEVTPFAYGHFNAWPIDPIFESPNNGAIDWARNAQGFSLIPGEIFGAMRQRGAEVVQVNHPRSGGGLVSFMQYFDRAALAYDYENRVVAGDQAGQPIPNDFLRLPPGAELFDPNFNALEVWNGFSPSDLNDDGVREMASLDRVLRDWFNFNSFGMRITPIGNSDSHDAIGSPLGMPRTYVRVLDDSPAALASGAVVDEVLDTLAGRAGTPVDVVVTNGPHIAVEVDGDPAPLGAVFDGTAGSIEVTVTITAPTWALFDTVEIFANATPEIDEDGPIEPLACFTSRPQGEIMANDPCALASLGGAQAMTVDVVQVAAGFDRLEATVSLTINAGAIATRAGATGTDAWFVIRARGDRSVFPLLLDGLFDDGNIDVFVDPPSQEALDAELDGRGIPAAAFTAPFFVDFDGGGYLAPFSP
jgi:hypothetical protein